MHTYIVNMYPNKKHTKILKLLSISNRYVVSYKITKYGNYLGPGPTISGQQDGVQNSEIVPYIKLICSKNPIAAKEKSN